MSDEVSQVPGQGTLDRHWSDWLTGSAAAASMQARSTESTDQLQHQYSTISCCETLPAVKPSQVLFCLYFRLYNRIFFIWRLAKLTRVRR